MRVISRRQALATLGGLGAGVVLAACAGDDDTAEPGASRTTTPPDTGATQTSVFDGAGSCTLTPEMTEGPFYLDLDQVRSDIAEGRPGVPLRVAIRVQDTSCQPIKDAAVDIWHCDAEGEYSASGDTFCRGTQVTDADGAVEFTTVYPGWYRGRTVHIHAKVHLDNRSVLTTQLYFDDAVTDEVFTNEPYGQGDRDRNEDDGIFLADTILTLSRDGDGYLGALNVNVAAS